MKAFNRLSAGLCLSVFLFCPVHGVWGQGAGESSWQLKGLVDTYHAFRSEKPNDWMSSRTRLRGEVGKNFAGSSLFVSFNATYNALTIGRRTGAFVSGDNLSSGVRPTAYVSPTSSHPWI